MNKRCLGCYSIIFAAGFCQDCIKDFSKPSCEDSNGRTCLFEYKGVLRSTIMRAKVRNDLNALSGLRDLFVLNPFVLESASTADRIVPIPSSLWGRLRGRFDLAEALALGVSAETGVATSSFPRSTYWRHFKRAGKNRQKRDPQKVSRSKPLFAGLRIQLIDDVMTTGQTMRWAEEAALSLGAISVSCAVLAMANG